MAEVQNQNKVDRSAQAQIWNLIYGFADSLILRCAVELRLADIIAANEKPISLSKLASQLPFPSVNKDHLYRILRYLVHMKLFSSVSGDAPAEPHYGLAPAGKYLVSGWDQCMNPTILIVTDRDIMAPFHHIKEALAADGPSTFERVLGMDIWDFMAANPEKNKLFNEGMAGDTRLLTATLIRECGDVFEGIGSLVDVGGGTGTALLAIARAFPHIKCKVFDLPHVIADSPEYPEVEKVEGDMFKYIPAADAILMKCILHDWDDEKSVEILKKCKEAVREVGGKVIIVDIVLDVKSDHPYTRMRISMDLDMMLTTGGKERSENAWRKLISDAGFKGFNIRHISATQSLIEAFP